MADAAGSVLIAFTATLVLFTCQKVSDVMGGAAGSVLTAFTATLALLA